jgi:cytochrome b561
MIRDSARGYGLLSIFFHWFSALTVIFLFALGVYLTSYGYYSADYLQYAHLHYALGVIVFAVFTLRLVWRLANKTPSSLSEKFVVRLMIKAIKAILYLLVFAVLVSGYLICTSEGQSISVFGLFQMPALIGLDTAGINLAGLTHKYTAWALMGFVVAHAFAALVHHYIIKDLTLRRMLTPKLSKSEWYKNM